MNTFQQELDFIRSNLPTWKDLKDQDVDFFRCAFGQSRATYRVTSKIPSASPNPIILRKFVEAPQPGELENFERMSSEGIGPKMYVYDAKLGLRIEQYFESRLMKNYEINQRIYRRKLACKLASIHRLKIEKERPRKCFIEEAMDRWIVEARTNCESPLYNEEQKESANNLRYLFDSSEVDFVLKTVNQFDLVWSHNDIWTGNILITKPDEQVLLIDYEVTNFNFKGYDIGKLMMEVLYERHEGKPTYDFLKIDVLPSHDDMADFCRCYLITLNGGSIKNCDDDVEINAAWNLIEERDRKLEDLLKEVDVGIMISGYYSALLGMWIALRFTSMDFILFAKHGEIMYKEFKQRLAK